jgi:hypothetical protein
VLGMKSLTYQDPRPDLEALGISPLSANESLTRALRGPSPQP